MTKYLPLMNTRSLFLGFAYSTLSALLLITAGCNGDNNADSTGLTEVDLSSEFSASAEVDRLRFFRETKTDSVRKKLGLTGKGVRITIMGEIVDASHPDLQMRVMQQFNTFSQKGSVLPGTGNQPHRLDLYGTGSGHGTHIAGTLAAECDGVGIQGIACGALLDVYDIGAYGNEAMPVNGWGDTHEFGRLFSAFSTALDDVRQRGLSRITTGSFNIEAPAVSYKSGGSLEGMSVTQIVAHVEDTTSSIEELLNANLAEPVNSSDQELLRRVTRRYNDITIPLGTFLPKSQEWKVLETAIANYQQQDGVYLVTESNYSFESRSSVLNAMPTLSEKIDKDLWLSVVMTAPDNAENYTTPLNTCGEMAQNYCILTPSYEVLSTMTHRMAEPGETLYLVEQRAHQVYSGHSMGAPMVAAALALMEEHNVTQSMGYTMKKLVDILKDNANRSFTGYDAKKHGRGLLDIYAALQAM